MSRARTLLLLAVSVWAAAAAAAEPPPHLIYLHGRIVQEQQDARPQSPRFGYYELEKILGELRSRGFVVTGEIRPRSASVSESADRVVEQVRALLASGVPADRILVVGASMGGGIALVSSARLQKPELRFAVLGACASETEARLVAGGVKGLSGRVLSIHEESDAYTQSCPPWTEDPARPGVQVREIVVHTGLEHGFLYRPLPEWVDPVVEWSSPGKIPAR
jgi:hypothetical protein